MKAFFVIAFCVTFLGLISCESVIYYLLDWPESTWLEWVEHFVYIHLYVVWWSLYIKMYYDIEDEHVVSFVNGKAFNRSLKTFFGK